MIEVARRARRHRDAAGDPLDGLVNLFDLGIVLSVGFLLAALSSLHLAASLTKDQSDKITVPARSQVKRVPADGRKVVGNGTAVGKVYRLDDGRLVYVVPPARSTAPPSSPSSPSGRPSSGSGR